MKNRADYSKEKADPKREMDRLRRLDIIIGSARVVYKGNEIWIGLRGKRLNGYAAAEDYAKKLHKLIEKTKELKTWLV